MNRKILVIGATGVVGSHLTRNLVCLGESVRAATRQPMESARRFPVAAEFVELDLERPETFAPALRGVDRVFLMARARFRILSPGLCSAGKSLPPDRR